MNPDRFASARIEDAGNTVRDEGDAPEGSALRTPEGLASRYARLVLANHERDLGAATLDDALILSCDWLFWQHCVETGRPCLHVEYFLRSSLPEGVPEEDAFLRYMRWVSGGDDDPTRFLGVSLGGLMWREATMFAMAYDRLRHALERTIERFGIERIDAYGFTDHYSLIPREEIRTLLREVADAHGISLTDRLADDGSQESPWGRESAEPRGAKETLKRIMALPVAAAFRLRRWIGGNRPGVFLLHNPVVVRALLDSRAAQSAAPVLTFQQWPKTPGFLARCWWRGTILAPLPLPAVSLNPSEEWFIADMIRNLDDRQKDATGRDGALWRVLRQRHFNDTALRALVKRIKAYRQLFRRWGVAQAVIADISNIENRIVAEAAADLDIPVDELPNGIFLCHKRNDAREGGRESRPAVRRGLAWSRPFETTMRQDLCGQPIRVIGYPPIARAAPRRATTARSRTLVDPADPGRRRRYTGTAFQRTGLRAGCHSPARRDGRETFPAEDAPRPPLPGA